MNCLIFTQAGSKNNAFNIPLTPVIGNWYVGKLGGSNFTFINKTGWTQFRLHFGIDDDNDKIADVANFYTSDNATLQPVLVITYYIP